MKTQKGITLIALIITIIVMLILVGVSVSTAINTGLFKTASEVSQNTEKQKENEIRISKGEINIGDEYIDINQYADGLTGDINIGDYVNYNCKEGVSAEDSSYLSLKAKTGAGRNQEFTIDNYSAGWRMLGKNENGEILLIAEDVLQPSFTLGSNGFSEGEKELNNICAIYGHGNGAVEARSVKLEDINKLTEGKLEELDENSIAYKIVFTNGNTSNIDYWLNDRATVTENIDCEEENCESCGIAYIGDSTLDFSELLHYHLERELGNNGTHGVRPVVILDKNVKLSNSGEIKNGCKVYNIPTV